MRRIFKVYFDKVKYEMEKGIMSLKRFAQALSICLAILSLAACSAHRRSDQPDVNDMNAAMSGGAGSGASATGAGGSANWGDENLGGSRSSKNKRTYYFDYDKSDVHDSDKPSIYANANYLIAHPHARVLVEGHTDPRGSREYNVALGERRANAVVELLMSKGVGNRQVRVISYGAERLASPGHSESDYQLDRRAVIVYTQK